MTAEDRFSGWVEAKPLRKPTTEKVLEFLTNCVARHGKLKVIRTSTTTTKFRSKKFKDFCNKPLIRHIEYPIRDHRGNGKVERLINERLQTNKHIVVRRDNL